MSLFSKCKYITVVVIDVAKEMCCMLYSKVEVAVGQSRNSDFNQIHMVHDQASKYSGRVVCSTCTVCAVSGAPRISRDICWTITSTTCWCRPAVRTRSRASGRRVLMSLPLTPRWVIMTAWPTDFFRRICQILQICDVLGLSDLFNVSFAMFIHCCIVLSYWSLLLDN